MSQDICDLLKNPKFVFKIADAASTFYGTKNLFESEAFSSVLNATVVSLAYPGAFMIACILIMLYKIDQRSDFLESILLKVYGAINVWAIYVCIERMRYCTGFENNIFNPMNCMMVSAIVSAVLMLGEDLYLSITGKE